MFTIKEDIIQAIKLKLAHQFDGKIKSVQMSLDILEIDAEKDSLVDLFQFLFKDEQLKFRFLTTLCGIHYPERKQLGVVYHLHSFVTNTRIRIKAFAPEENPVFPTITGIFAAANWMERETWDFFGIRFDGHPNLKRILNVDDMTDFPLRKEFPLEDATRDDKDDSMFGR
jgi:NADH-quinone oxidoreductase subunit C